ncbi:MAG: nuclear transport factor 2 family protein [Actinomycetota bacterium]|nr:nuclear transport factor 2 family protein [Actinomycetota bacterium]
MSQENVEIIRRMYERWLDNDASLFDAFDQEIELHPDPAADWVGVDDIYRGHDGVRSYMAQVYDAFEDYRPEVEELLDAGDRVITLAIEHGRGRSSGATVEPTAPPTCGRCARTRRSALISTLIESKHSKPPDCEALRSGSPLEALRRGGRPVLERWFESNPAH